MQNAMQLWGDERDESGSLPVAASSPMIQRSEMARSTTRLAASPRRSGVTRCLRAADAKPAKAVERADAERHVAAFVFAFA